MWQKMWQKNKAGLLVPGASIREHHSLADWDYHSLLTYSLDNSIYQSAPSSLKISTSASSGRVPFLCRISDALSLPQGRFESYWRHQSWTATTNLYPAMYFRQQSALGAFDVNNTYYLQFRTNVVYLIKYVASVKTDLGSFSISHSTNTWYRERVTWWKEAGSLAVRYEYWSGSAWVIVTPDLYDNTPSFEGSGTNRCGGGLENLSSYGPALYTYWDDTYIEGP